MVWRYGGGMVEVARKGRMEFEKILKLRMRVTKKETRIKGVSTSVSEERRNAITSLQALSDE